MFDEDDYYSDEEQTHHLSHKPSTTPSKVLAPSSGSDFNHLTGDGQSLLKMMKERGFDLADHEIKKIKQPIRREKSLTKNKPKAGFFDGGDKASLEQLMKALNKAFSKADPQQASCILSYILEKKNLSPHDKNKFGLMKCNILFGLGAYEDCLDRALEFMETPYNKLSAAILSNMTAKCKGQLDQVLSGYMDLLRAKSLIEDYKDQLEVEEQSEKSTVTEKSNQELNISEIQTTIRQISHTQLQYNIKMSHYRNNTNLIHPYFLEFRHRKILKVACGDFHTLFLVNGSLDQNQKESRPNWRTQVFGLGQDTVGQISGKQKQIIYDEPILISDLSGKGIQGICANKQSSLGYDSKGNIYEWGIKEKRNQSIEITYSVGEEISQLEKGYKHYSLMTKSGKFYSWGKIQMKGTTLYNQPKPQLQGDTNIVNFSCGNHHTLAIDADGYAYALGNNDSGQLGIVGERFTKSFKKINNYFIEDIRKVFCLGDCSFFINSNCEVFFCGKYSQKSNTNPNVEQLQEKIREAEFSDEFKDIISISGSTGIYYLTNEKGDLYRWQVDNMVKFKKDPEHSNISQRYAIACKSNTFRIKSTIQPELCSIRRITSQMKTYEPIQFELTLKDEFGLYGLTDFIITPKCQIFFSTYKMKQGDLMNENKLFLEGTKFPTSNSIILNQIVESRLLSYNMKRNETQSWIYDMEIVTENSGKYFFYVLLNDSLIFQQQLQIQVSEKQKELEEKNRLAKQLKEEQRRRKAQLERQRLAQQKMRKQMEEDQRRKQTQKRAQQALKKHMREQEEAKIRVEEERKAKKQLQTGGGYDLNKLKVKNEQLKQQQIKPKNVVQKSTELKRKTEMDKTGESFLPDINQRPSSRKKLNLPKPSQLIGMVKPQRNFLPSAKNQIPVSTMSRFTGQKSSNLMKKQTKEGMNSTGTTGFRQSRNLVKRPNSKKK